MKTPICDFVRQYAESKTTRLHMPGHKGESFLGFEHLDITEIKGADSLYEADGIIAESEKNASSLFGCDTFYSAEGSSLCIRAMLYLACLYAKEHNKSNLIFAGRNAHKTFLNTAALLDFEIKWLINENSDSYLSFTIDKQLLENAFAESKDLPFAVYITSPDYLGNVTDIKAISEVCKKYGVLLLVDNAHGAYLKFLPQSQHPTELGADMCCDSAHKTLPVLTGGAYLHIAKEASDIFKYNAKKALSLFGSTSPSYLIMQSLDKANEYLDGHYREKLKETIKHIAGLKQALIKNGYMLWGNEPLKITIDAKKYGYTGYELADILRKNNVECEFADPDYLVLMLTTENTDVQLNSVKNIMLSIERKQEITVRPPKAFLPIAKMSVREAAFSPCQSLDIHNCLGKTLAFAEVGCPPAVPIVVCGEVIDESAVKCFEYYGIESCSVVK